MDDSGKRSDDRASKRGKGAFLGQSAENFQENVTKSASVAGASYALIGAIILLGGIGFALDRWLGTSPWFLLGGLLLGIIVGFYELAKIVWPSKR